MKAIALFVMAVVLLNCSSDAHAQQASRKTYLEVIEVQKLWDATDYNGALAKLNSYYPATVGNPYDQAVVLQYIGQTYVFLDRVDKAREALQESLTLPNLDRTLMADLHLMFGQIVLGDDDFKKATESLEFWYANTAKERQPSVLFSLGYANYMSGNLPRAEEVIENAIGLVANPNKSWYRVYYQALFDQQKYERAEAVLLGMIAREPLENDNWRLLANHHLLREDSKQALAVIAIAYQNGLLDGDDDLQRMIALYSSIEIPEKAARLLQKQVEDNAIASDEETLTRLGSLWLLAREREKASQAFERAAAIAPDGKTYELLGNVYFEDEKWGAAHAAYTQAIQNGGLSDPERIYLLAGISADRGGMTDAARTAYREARKSDKLRSQADALLKRLD